MFFIRRGISPEVLRCLESLLKEYEKRNKWLETENLRLIGLAYPLTGSPTNEATPMTHEDEQRAINLTDAAGRASNNGLLDLALKLSQQAEKLLGDTKGQSFQDFGASRGLNMERLHGQEQHFASKHTQDLFECWLAARGQKVWMPPEK